MLNDWFLLKTLAEKSKWKRHFNDLDMEKKEEPMRFFARVDKMVGVMESLRVHLLTKGVNLKIVEVLTDDYEFEQRTILYRDNITRAEIEAIVKQRHTIMSIGASTKVRIVGQALIANKPGPRNRKEEGSGKGGRAGKGVSDDVVAAKNDNSSSTKVGKYNGMRNKCHRCLEPGHGWFNCTVRVISAAEKSQNGCGEIIGCLAIGMLGEEMRLESASRVRTVQRN